jgi:hypothetical protein
MGAVTLQLGRESVRDWVSTSIFFGSGALLLSKWKGNTTLLMLGGALAGWFAHMTGLIK